MQRSSRPSTGRRNYTRNSNNSFKFHNFVFNEDNQSFCLEEQHGNKKITVLHWKKSGDRSVEDEKVPEPELEPEPVPLSKSGKTVSRQLSKTSSDSTSASKRRTHEVTTSASFPPPSGRPTVTSPITLPLSPTEYSNNSLTTTTSLPPSSPSLRHTSSGSSYLSPTDTFHSSFNEHLCKSNSQPDYTKWNTSSSSIATSSSSSSSQVAKWLNQSLNDLDLTELSNRSVPTSRRKPIQVRRIVVDDDDDSEKSGAESDNEMPSETEMINSFEKYRRYLMNVEDRFEDKVQTQPLDLSTKTKRDHNNNNTTSDWNIDSILGLKRSEKTDGMENSSVGAGRAETFTSTSSKMDHLKQGFDRLQVPSSSWTSDWESTKSSFRSDAVSPSTLISSVKCCSPSHKPNAWQDRTATACVNPFLFTSSQFCHPTASSFMESSPTSATNKHSSSLEENAEQPPLKPSSRFMFDSFQNRLEEEISKMLQTSSCETKRDRTDIEERIEDKLRSLHREVLNRKEAFNDNLEPGQDHLKMHFKLDANKNLELFGGDGRRNMSEPCLNRAEQIQTMMLARSRPSQRNQIKRQLEDAFKQNGFLVKTKQVSDPANSAMFVKFRQLRKYTRYYLKSWQTHLPDEVNKLWKGFLPPQTERPLYVDPSSSLSNESPM